jgi:hypothetical protein
MTCGSETYRADRRPDPTPINNLAAPQPFPVYLPTAERFGDRRIGQLGPKAEIEAHLNPV